MFTPRLLRTAASLLLAAALGTPALAQPIVLREGEGARRTQLDGLELKPFSIASFDKLSDWTNGSAPTSGSLDGKVVLILFWNDYYPAAAKSVNFAKRLAEKHKGDLVVVGVYGSDGWKDAKKPKSEVEGANFLLAHDAKGEFRAALKADQDPDFFIIDRSGQMRYADIQTESVEGAVDYVVAEAKDKAAGLSGEIAARVKAEDAARRRSEGIRDKVDMTAIPEIPFQMPLPEAYSKDKVNWPKMPRDPNAQPEDPKNPTPRSSSRCPTSATSPRSPAPRAAR